MRRLWFARTPDRRLLLLAASWTPLLGSCPLGPGCCCPPAKINLGSPGKHHDNHVDGVEASEYDYCWNRYQNQIIITAHVLCALVYAIVYSYAVHSWEPLNTRRNQCRYLACMLPVEYMFGSVSVNANGQHTHQTYFLSCAQSKHIHPDTT